MLSAQAVISWVFYSTHSLNAIQQLRHPGTRAAFGERDVVYAHGSLLASFKSLLPVLLGEAFPDRPI